LQAVRKAESSVLFKVEARLCEALKLSWLFVANVQTIETSDEKRPCEAIELLRQPVKPRIACFPKNRIEAAPQNPAKRPRLETQSKKEG
jgi:hypothetical protein